MDDSLLYFVAVRAQIDRLRKGVSAGGRYWFRTSDLSGVSGALSR